MDADRDGRHDFDWILGPWRVRNRRLVDQTDPACDEWVEFDGRSEVTSVLDGLGHVDVLTCDELPDGAPLHAVTVRPFDPAPGLWTIYWASARYPGAFDVPVVGRFDGTLGVFEADDTVAGLPTRLRFEWRCDDPDAPTWQQSFSRDGGPWWANWQMSLSRPATP